MELLSPDKVIPLSKLVGKYTLIVKLARDYHKDCPSSGSTAKKNLREESVLYYLTMLKAELEAMSDSDDKVEMEFRDKIVAWLKEYNYYAVLHDGHWGRYFHVRTLDDTCDELTNEIYSAFLESYNCEFNDKGKFVIDYNFHVDTKFTWEWLYKRVVLNEQIPEDRRCSICGKELTDEEYYTCAKHTKPITFKL